MTLAVFSEIKWEYLTTRKQQLFSRFPTEWRILFLEPYKAGMTTSVLPRRVKPHILVATMPFSKNFPPGTVSMLFARPWFRAIYYAVTAVWVRFIMMLARIPFPDVAVVSNLHAVPLVPFRWKVVYDMNDHHLAFENTPSWLERHFKDLCARAERIVISATSLGTLCPAHSAKVLYIGNGVDNRVFARTTEVRQEAKEKVVLYTGAISEIVDFELLGQIVRRMPAGYTMRMVGPVFPSVKPKLDALLAMGEGRTSWVPAQPQSVLADFVAQSYVCLIPFVDSSLTRHVNPNKAYEYLACGKPVVAMHVTDELDRMQEYLLTAKNREEFVELALRDFDHEPASVIEARKAFALENDWSAKAQQYTTLLKDLCTKSK